MLGLTVTSLKTPQLSDSHDVCKNTAPILTILLLSSQVSHFIISTSTYFPACGLLQFSNMSDGETGKTKDSLNM